MSTLPAVSWPNYKTDCAEYKNKWRVTTASCFYEIATASMC